jgi:hypothetical protein
MASLRKAVLPAITLWLLLPLSARARTVTITITGTVASGTDDSGVFGKPGPLSGKFILVYTFDDAKAETGILPCQGDPAICFSQIGDEGKKSPGTATLQINDSAPYTFGLPLDEDTTSMITKNVWPYCCYHIQFTVSDRNGGVGASIGNISKNSPAPTAIPKPTPPPTTNPDWRDPFSDSKTVTVPGNPPAINFTISNSKSGAKASGLLMPTSICVGEGCGVMVNSCDQAVGRLKQYQLPAGDVLGSFVKMQVCIADTACSRKSSLNNPPWLDALINDFVDPFLGSGPRWSEIIANCRNNHYFGFRNEYCQYITAHHHIKVDLQHALEKDGCGTTEDWSSLAQIISECLNKERPFDPLGRWFANLEVQDWRDDVRQACIAFRGQ